MDQVHVIRHQVLVEGRSQRQVANEFGISRRTVRKYVAEAAPRRKEARPRARPVWTQMRRGRGVAHRVGGVDGREAAVDGDAVARVVGAEGHRRRGDRRQGRRRGVEAATPRGVRAADVSARGIWPRSTSSRSSSISTGSVARRGCF